MVVANSLAYYGTATVMAVKFYTTASGAGIIKHYGPVMYGKWTYFTVI